MAKSSKIQKKSFFEVETSATGAKISLYAASAQELNGKIVRLDLTRSLRGKSLELKLKVKADGEKLVGEPVALELAGSYVRRMMRKGSDYVEDSFIAECKDANVILKPFMITRHKVSRSVRKMLRDTAKQYLLAHFRTRTTKEVSTEITTNKLQKELSLILKKIYPLALCEIRVFEILEENKKGNTTEKSNEQKPIEEKKSIEEQSKEDFKADKKEKKETAKETQKEEDSPKDKKEKKNNSKKENEEKTSK
jgi:ribosomal protein S3AE